MKKSRVGIILLLAAICLMTGKNLHSEEGEMHSSFEKMNLSTFLKQAMRKDTVFERILLDELDLNYKKDNELPARDLILSVKTQYDLFLDDSRTEPEMAVGLSKLFPYTGTEVSAEHKLAPSLSSGTSSANFDFSLSQPIVQNAFGRAYRLHEKIVGVEIDVARHQIIEAYEDYAAELITAFYSWKEAYENLKIAESSYAENVKLLDNIEERRKSKIAVAIDVNKINLQVLAKKETLVSLEEEYKKAENVIRTAIRYQGTDFPVPGELDAYLNTDVSFADDFRVFKEKGRTFKVLELLEEKSALDVKKEFDDLFPSVDLIFGYELSGDEYDYQDSEEMMYAGVSIDFPFPDQVDRAEFKLAEVQKDRRELVSDNVYYQLYRDLKNLSLAIDCEAALLRLAEEKIEFAKAVLKDESENYTYGKVTLNDYIDAVNKVDNNRFNKIKREAELNKLRIEWLRVTDRLIQKGEDVVRRGR